MKKTSLYVILAAIIGVVVMITPLTFTPTQQPTLLRQETSPLPVKEYKQGVEEAKTIPTVEVEETKQPSITYSITAITLISALSLLPAFITSLYIKKRIKLIKIKF
ncbi:MAG: hypothetical protein ACKD6N_00570 [Candidatus Bathyarchaeota archaeon]